MFMRFIYVLFLMCFMTEVVVAQQTGGPGGGGGGGSGSGVGGNCAGPGPIAVTCLVPDGLTSCRSRVNREWRNTTPFNCATTKCDLVDGIRRCLLDPTIIYNFDVPEDEWITDRPEYKTATAPGSGENYKSATTNYPCVIEYRCTGCNMQVMPIGYYCAREERVAAAIEKYVKCIVDGQPVSCPGTIP